MLKHGRLVLEVLWWECGLVHVEWVDIRKLRAVHVNLGVEAMHHCSLLTEMNSAIGSWHRQGSSRTEHKTRGVEISSLTMVDRVGTTRCWGVVTGYLAGKGIE